MGRHRGDRGGPPGARRRRRLRLARVGAGGGRHRAPGGGGELSAPLAAGCASSCGVSGALGDGGVEEEDDSQVPVQTSPSRRAHSSHCHLRNVGTGTNSGPTERRLGRRTWRDGTLGPQQDLPRNVVLAGVARVRPALAGVADFPRVVFLYGAQDLAPEECVRGRYDPRKVPGEHRHPKFDCSRLVRLQHRYTGRVERVDHPRAPRLRHAASSAAGRPDQIRAVVSPTDADPGHDEPGAVSSSQLEQAAAHRMQAAGEPVAWPSGQNGRYREPVSARESCVAPRHRPLPGGKALHRAEGS